MWSQQFKDLKLFAWAINSLWWDHRHTLAHGRAFEGDKPIMDQMEWDKRTTWLARISSILARFPKQSSVCNHREKCPLVSPTAFFIFAFVFVLNHVHPIPTTTTTAHKIIIAIGDWQKLQRATKLSLLSLEERRLDCVNGRQFDKILVTFSANRN